MRTYTFLALLLLSCSPVTGDPCLRHSDCATNETCLLGTCTQEQLDGGTDTVGDSNLGDSDAPDGDTVEGDAHDSGALDGDTVEGDAAPDGDTVEGDTHDSGAHDSDPQGKAEQYPEKSTPASGPRPSSLAVAHAHLFAPAELCTLRFRDAK